MKCFLKSVAFKVILGIIFIISGVVLYTVSNPNDNVFLNAVVSITLPIQKAMSYVSNSAFDFIYQFEEKEKLKEENESLKKQINELRDVSVDYYDVKRENARFEKYYGIKESDKSLKFVSASVVGRDPTDFFGDFVIDKGSDSGVSLNDAVITENGMVGRICQLGKGTSRVKTILSPESKIGVVNSKTGDSGIISGTIEQAKNNFTRMTFISAQNIMAQGDIVVTAGTSGMYPKNLKLGKIRSVEYDDYESSYYALVEPFEKIREIRDVFVVMDFKGKGELDISGEVNLQGDKNGIK